MNERMFISAEPIFIKGKSDELNYTAGFAARFTAKSGSVYRLRIAAASFVRVRLDGEFLHFGPARAPHGFARVDELTLNVSEGEHRLTFELAGYSCACYYVIRVSSFLCAELCEDGEPIAYTGGNIRAISLTDYRERRVPHFSHQRAFSEVYDLYSSIRALESGDFVGEETETIEHGCEYIARGFAMPEFSLTDDAEFVRNGRYTPYHSENVRLPNYFALTEAPYGFKYSDCPNDVLDATTAEFTDIPEKLSLLSSGEFAQYKFARINSGFIRVEVDVHEPSVIYVIWGERLRERDIMCGNMPEDTNSSLNIIKYTLPIGHHTLESFEPYSLMHVAVMVDVGSVGIRQVKLCEYCYPVGKLPEPTGDAELDSIVAACRNIFAQNTVDCFMDCPGRERGGWLCDSYFTAQAAYLFTGDTECERLYLDNFRIAKYFKFLPEGILPMNYPADLLREVSIPQWTLWFVAELYEFGKRGGAVEPFYELVSKILRFFGGYENSDGLLEKLPYWNFVEWSKANQWVQDVNYPTNMLYSYILKNVGEMYSLPELCGKSARIRDNIIEQSFDGKYFRDHAIRVNGELVLQPDRSAICQHEAFMFDIADDSERFVPLKQRLIEHMGVDGDYSKLPKDLEPLNLFIGYAVRVEVLMKLGCYERNIDEIKRLYGRMIRETGTIWEMKIPSNSLNHGFGSFVAAKLIECKQKLKKETI